MQKEELMLQKRLIELSRTAYRRGIICYSDFLNLNELNILHTTPHNEFDTMYCSSGGYMYSERQMCIRDRISFPFTKTFPPSIWPVNLLLDAENASASRLSKRTDATVPRIDSNFGS